MKRIQISKFKEHCISIIDELNKTNETVIVTRRGKPAARVEPAMEKIPKRKLGTMRGSVVIKNDIVNLDFSSDGETSI